MIVVALDRCVGIYSDFMHIPYTLNPKPKALNPKP